MMSRRKRVKCNRSNTRVNFADLTKRDKFGSFMVCPNCGKDIAPYMRSATDGPYLQMHYLDALEVSDLQPKDR